MVKGKLKQSMKTRSLLAAAFVLALVVCLVGVSSASAMGPWWQLRTSGYPTVLPAQGEGRVVALAENLGDGEALGSEIVFKDKLPAGVSVQGISFEPSKIKFDVSFLCETTVTEAICKLPAQFGSEVPFFAVGPYETMEMRVAVKVEGTVSGENETSISGGGAVPRVIRAPLSVGGAAPKFGVEDYELTPEAEGGGPDTQAGSHPFQLTSTLTLNQGADSAKPPALAKDLRFNLPAGLIGNPAPFLQCSQADFAHMVGITGDHCPNNTAIGVAVITFDEPSNPGLGTVTVPLFNLKPSPAEPARFGFYLLGTLNVLDTSVRTGGGYNVIVEDRNITELVNFIAARVTFWGVPGDPVHDSVRGWSCINEKEFSRPGFELFEPCKPLGGGLKPPPLLTLPTSCTGPMKTDVQGDSWSERGVFFAPFEAVGTEGVDGCNSLPFSSSLSVAPDGPAASTPSGLTVGIHVPQEEALNGTGLSPADVKDTTVTLPAGVALNPAAADGLQTCTDTPEPGRPEGEIGLGNAGMPSCPEASKVATVEISSPLLPNPLVGAAYLAAQNQNPFGSLIALYLVARDPVSGVLVKVAGEVKPDPLTGQLVSTFNETPQLPFEDLKLHFFGGDRAPLGSPAVCGAYTTTALIAPWSGGDPSTPTSTFDITSGPNGSPCPAPLPFAPTLTAGSTNIQAGAFSPFTMTMSREDGNQNLKAIKLKMPPGLLGTLATVKLCDEANANAGTCGAESEIGETIVSVGLGGDPYSVRGGKVYITGPYRGASFGLSIVNPAKAGPFDLGQVVVRAKVEVNPIDASLNITTDTSGPYAIPQILAGIPLQIKHVNVVINRPNFTFNPTNCSPMTITGTLTSSQDTNDTLSLPFQATNCATFAFKPQFKVYTAGKTSRSNGASLDAKLTYPKAAWGTQANIKSVKVDLPRQLPSRLTTLQKACTAAVFNANPAACPAPSRIGTATATTPIVPVSLSGPAYFVSYGGAKFPELVIVLSGYGVTVDLHGETFISPAGITSSTFRSIPDVPIGSFELKLPEGPFSALGANANLCNVKGGLKMPTTFVAQNGLQIKQSTPITATGCPKHRKGKKASGHRKKR